jgi:enterobacterial common antigen flippase
MTAVSDDTPPAAPAVSRPAPPRTSSYRDILRSSALVGGATALVIVIGIVRTKVMALLLGPAGFGLMGALTAIADLARSIAGLGINASGVRQIAEANGSGDERRVARTAFVLRRACLVLGLVGAAAMLLLSDAIARLTFQDAGRAGLVALLSLAVLFRLLADGQGALVQGLRRIGDMSRSNVYAALLGSVAGISLVYLYGVNGVASAVVAIALASALTGWWYSRNVRLPAVKPAAGEAWTEASALLRLGVAFMASAMLIMGAAYVVRLIIIRQIDLEAAGYFQAAWTIGGLYIGILTQAMGSDFYPRLVGAIGDHEAANRMVNEQAQVGLLLAGVGVLATIALAPYVVTLFYSPQFLAATDSLRWICLGMALRVVSFPIGYVVVAKGSQGIYIATELAWTVVNIALSWYCIERFGLVGAAIAFCGSCVFHVAMIYPIVHRMTGFRWSAECWSAGAWMLGLTVLAFVASMVLPGGWALAVGLAATAVAAWLSLRELVALMDDDSHAEPMLPRALRNAIARWRPQRGGGT